jgi:hypothetical protein
MGHRTLGYAMASSLAVRRWLGGGSVDAVSTSGAISSRWAWRQWRSPTEEAAWHGGGEGGAARWCLTEEVAPVDGAPWNDVRLQRALCLEEEEGVRRGAASRGWRGLGWLSPVEAVSSVAWMKSSVEEGFWRLGTGSTSSPECGGTFGFLMGCSSSKNGAWEGRGDGSRGEWGGPVSARPSGEGGGLAMACARAGGPGHERRAVGWRQPGDDGAVSRTGEAGEEREGRERGRLVSGANSVWGLANRGKGVGDRWGRLQCRWFKLDQTEPNQFERI